MLPPTVLIFLAVSGLFHCYTAMVIPQHGDEELSQTPQQEITSDQQDDEESQIFGPNADEVGPFVEGDMIYPGGFERHIRAVTNQDYRKWFGAIVPYTIDSYYNSAQKQIIYSAMDEIQTKTCINFVERSTEADYIRIMPGEGCSSYVGRRGGQQVVTLDPWRCLGEVGVVAHELFHVLGFYHEHTRLDRDTFIDVLWNNMEGGREVNFHKRSPGTIDNLGKAYDYNSVMHYSAYAFSLDERRPTLVPRYPTINLKSLGQRRELSPLDVEKANGYYSCDSRGRTRETISEEPSQPEYVHPNEDNRIYKTTTTTTLAPTTLRAIRPIVRSKNIDPPRQMDSPCDGNFHTNAMLSTLDDQMVIMNAKNFWVVDSHRYLSKALLIRDYYPGLPDDIDAAFTWINAKNFWVVDSHRYLSKALLIRDYYPGLPDDIDAAFTWINGHTYFFKGTSYWKYQGYQKLEGYPQDIKSGFPGLPDAIDAAFLWTKGRILFAKDNSYWTLNPTYFNQIRGPFALGSDLGFPTKIDAGLEWPSLSSADPDVGSTNVWVLADQVMYPVDASTFKVSPDQPAQKLMDWLRCDLYVTNDRLADPDIKDMNSFW